MNMEQVFAQFGKVSPLPVMARIAIEHATSDEFLDSIFAENAERQEHRDVCSQLGARDSRQRLVDDRSAGDRRRELHRREAHQRETRSRERSDKQSAGEVRSRETGGTGLGLAIARDIAQSHGAELQVESSVGHGTTFTVRLHRSTRESPALQTSSERSL